MHSLKERYENELKVQRTFLNKIFFTKQIDWLKRVTVEGLADVHLNLLERQHVYDFCARPLLPHHIFSKSWSTHKCCETSRYNSPSGGDPLFAIAT
jgi:hypothetical protein